MPEKSMLDVQEMLHEAAASYVAGRYEDAVESCRAVLRIDPGNPSALHRLGLVARVHGDLKKAWELLQRAARLDASNASIQSDLGQLLLAREEFGGAIARF